MRQLTTLHDAPQAHLFADYLTALRIEARIDATADGWIVWVFDEDNLPRAREELQVFLVNPQDERFQKVAQQLPRNPEPVAPKAEENDRPRYVPFFSTRVTGGLIFASAIITIATSSFNPDATAWRNALMIAAPQGSHLAPGLPEVCHGQIWRLITPIFIHLDPLHLVCNMMALHFLGRQIEQRHGSLLMVGLVLLLAVFSNLGQYYFSEVEFEGGLPRPTLPNSFGGMSGVVFGLFGYVWMKSYFERDSGLYIAPQSVILMLGWFILCTTGLVGPIANTAHGVGLMTGMMIGYAGAWWNNWGLDGEEEEEEEVADEPEDNEEPT